MSRALLSVPERLVPAQVLRLQYSAGNGAVAALFSPLRKPVVQREFEDGDKTGSEPAAGTPIQEEAVTAAPVPTGVNEWGEYDGKITSDVAPHAFINNGKHGVGLVNWAGGPGGAGEQGTGSIDLTAPVYKTAAPRTPTGQAKAWIQAGTGKAKVTRSFKGVQKGANATYYFTSRACTRADVHEKLHVSSSKSIHDANISPLTQRVRSRMGSSKALVSGATTVAAQAALATFIDWNASVNAFTTQDVAANTPMGTVDTTDMARADFIRNYGPRAVKGVNFASYIDTPPGP